MHAVRSPESRAARRPGKGEVKGKALPSGALRKRKTLTVRGQTKGRPQPGSSCAHDDGVERMVYYLVV